MTGNGTTPMESAPATEEPLLPAAMAAVAMGVFVIVELVGTLYFNWHRNSSPLALMLLRQFAHMCVVGAVVHVVTRKIMDWMASRR